MPMHTLPEPFAGLTPDAVITAIESLGYYCDARVFPLNSYENRVFQVGIEGATPLIAKFYRPQRWTAAQILEEHAFSQALLEQELPVIAPIQRHNTTLFEQGGFRFALYPRVGGQAPELDQPDTLYRIGQTLGRIHALGAVAPFQHRPSLTLHTHGHASRNTLLECAHLPSPLPPEYAALSLQLLNELETQWQGLQYSEIRLHGDCHPGNILWRDDSARFVDFDDACNGPALQDLWMLLSGEPWQQAQQLACLLEGYEEFYSFERSQLHLLEGLRSLRLMHYSAWLARRWQDPAFPKYFPWFGSSHYWLQHLAALRSQLQQLKQPPLKLAPY